MITRKPGKGSYGVAPRRPALTENVILWPGERAAESYHIEDVATGEACEVTCEPCVLDIHPPPWDPRPDPPDRYRSENVRITFRPARSGHRYRLVTPGDESVFEYEGPEVP